MKKSIKIMYHVLFFITVLTFKAFSYESSHVQVRDTSYSTGYITASGDIVFNQYMTLNNLKVAFSQDNDKYIFKISADSSVKIYGDIFIAQYNSCSGSLVPMLYKEENFGNGMKISESLKSPYADCYNLEFYSKSEVKIKNKTQSKYVDVYYLSNTEHKTIESVNSNNGEKYFIPKSLRNSISNNWGFKYSLDYPIGCSNNGTGVSLDRNSSYSYCTTTGLSCDTYYAYMDAIVSIEKQYIDDYRYLCFAQECVALSSSDAGDLHYNGYGVSVCSNTIDLKEYVNCDHNWVYKIKDKLTHTKYCDKCKWDKEEDHSLLYEYDGIKYDVCTCSYIDKVKYRFVINDDVTGEVEEVCDTECSYSKHEFIHKKGYKFKWYEKYALRYKDITNLSTISNATFFDFVATTSEMDDIAENCSILYEAKYSPIKYLFNYSNSNNCDLTLDDKISAQEVYYDEKATLKKSIPVKGYIFKGWSLDRGSSKIDFAELEDVTNYTTEDLKEYTLYPIYERINFTLVYNAGSYTFAGGQKEKVVKYNYFDDGELEKPIINSRDISFAGYVDDHGNKYKKVSDVRNVIDKMQKSNITLHLRLVTESIGIGSIERTKKGGSNIEPTSESKYLLNNETSIATDLSKSTGVLDYSVPYYYEARRNFNKIRGMSKTNDEVVDEETEPVKDTPSVATISLIINKSKFDDGNIKKSKLVLLREFIENNKVLCIVVGSLLFAFLLLYELFIIRYYSKKALE